MAHDSPPQFPVGPFLSIADASDEDRQRWIDELSNLPSQLRQAIDGLPSEMLDSPYRNWSIRQIVHHIADSHVNSYVRFKWALTEDNPTIKAYDEGASSGILESRIGEIGPSLLLVEGLHARWTQLLVSLDSADFDRTFVHPESGETVFLSDALAYYAWHGRHHTGQIDWLRENRRV